MQRVYLDNAATSWPKPETVYAAMDAYQRTRGVAAGRGSYRDAEEVDRIVAQTRTCVAKFINAGTSSEIVFTHNCTDALNLALHGLLQPGDHVVTSGAEHNSILRPLHFLQEKRGIRVSILQVDRSGQIDLDQLATTVKDNCRLIAITHASNVTGTRQPIEAIAKIAKQHGCLLLVDAAQTLGHEPIDVQSASIDLLAAPGHKGLLGPLGTGLLYIRSELQTLVASTRQGGTGTESEQPRQPETTPEKYEAGNLNVPGIVGLGAGVQFLADQGLLESQHLLQLSRRLVEALADKSKVTLFSQPNYSGIVSFNLSGFDSRELATTLDSMASIQVRAGLHCAPLMHQSLGTLHSGGTVRASLGHFSKQAEVDTLVEAIETLVASPMT